MKKIMLCALLLTGSLYAQNETAPPPAEKKTCIKKGNFIIEANYGFPFFAGTFVTAIDKADPSADLKSSNTNHLGGRFEYVVSENIGVGAEYTYASVSAKENGTANSYKYTWSKQRMLARITFHFANQEKFNAYGIFGAGYKISDFKTDNPSFQAPEIVNAVPVAYRAAVGMRVFFIDMVGMHLEMGLGGPLIQAGVSLKF
jgi:opacity protein-like surface antigen